MPHMSWSRPHRIRARAVRLEMKCSVCNQVLPDDSPYRFYIPFTNGNGKPVDKRVCFTCHGSFEFATGYLGRIELNGKGFARDW